jgi:hypothetical protein
MVWAIVKLYCCMLWVFVCSVGMRKRHWLVSLETSPA